METSDQLSVQDRYLAESRSLQAPVTIFMMNGFQMKGIITAFDDFTVTVKSDGKEQMVYKHAISTVAPDVKRPDVQNPISSDRPWKK